MNATLNGHSDMQSVSTMTVTLMVNDAMRTTKKPEADAPLLKKNRKGMWHMSTMTLRQFASFIESGGTWRPGINSTSNTAKDVESLGLIALDFDGKDGRERYTEFEDAIAMTYRTLSWSEENPNKERVVFVLSRPVNKEEYVRLVKGLMTQFKSADAACTDAIRFFFGSSQPVTRLKEVTLDVEKYLKKFPAEEVKKSKAKSTSKSEEPKEKKEKSKGDFMTPAEFVYRDVLTRKLDGDVEALYCLHNHEFKNRTPDAEDSVLKLEGRNPFSATDSTGTSFVVTQMEGQLPIWHDRSKNAGSENEFNQGNGGSFFEYWFKLHKDFKNTKLRYSAPEIMASIYNHFGCLMPHEMTIVHYMDLLRHRTAETLALNTLGDIVEYGGEKLTDEIIPWFARVTGVYNERNMAVIMQCVKAVARENAYNPFIDWVTEYVNKYQPNKELWDNVASVMFGKKKSDPNYALYNKYIQNFYKGVLGRTIYPGLKNDFVMWLLGEQGGGKTLTLDRIVPFRFQYTSGKPVIDRDGIMAASQSVAHIMDDIDRLPNAQAAELKEYASKSQFTIREPYAPTAKTVKRSWGLAGTSNATSDTGFLADQTSQGRNRRHGIIPVTYTLVLDESISEETKEAIFGTLWATAYSEFMQISSEGGKAAVEKDLVLNRCLWETAADHNRSFVAKDALLEAVEQSIADKLLPSCDHVTMLEICQWVMPGKNPSPREQSSIADHMVNMGWTRETITEKSNGKRVQKRVWKRPSPETVSIGLDYEVLDYATALAPKEEVDSPTVAKKDLGSQKSKKVLGSQKSTVAKKDLGDLKPAAPKFVYQDPATHPDFLEYLAELEAKEQSQAPVTEAPKTETPMTEAPKTETPMTEAPKTEAPMTEAPKTETPVTEAPVTAPTKKAKLTLAERIAIGVAHANKYEKPPAKLAKPASPASETTM